MHRNADIELEIENFLKILRHKKQDTHIYIVSNEVGTGIVPENKLAREFRDLAGTMNQKVAGASDEVFMVVAGIPIKNKRLKGNFNERDTAENIICQQRFF